MEDGRATGPRATGPQPADTRAERLSRALRENLTRRKAQARARLESSQEVHGGTPPETDAGREP